MSGHSELRPLSEQTQKRSKLQEPPVRFFNLDLHIGVIGDIKQIFRSLGHEVVDWTISGHAWVMGRKRDKVEVVNERTWRNLNREMCNAFYERYKETLEEFDGFIVTHTPSFSMLFEKWNKPIICVASTRYEAPFSSNKVAWEGLNEYLRLQIDRGILIPVANNEYDARYAELFTKRKWQVIPSLCEYTAAGYTGNRSESLYFSKLPMPRPVFGLVDKRSVLKLSPLQKALRKFGFLFGKQGISWNEIADYRCGVWIPYNASIMSIFEMYAMGMPMLFPTLDFSLSLFEQNKESGAFSELSYNQVEHRHPGSEIACDFPDPNNFNDLSSMRNWMSKSDFYDSDNLKHLLYFDSFEEMESLLEVAGFQSIHESMMEHQKLRRRAVHGAWVRVLTDLENGRSL